MRFKVGDIVYHKGMIWGVVDRWGGYSIIKTTTGRIWKQGIIN